MCRGGVSVLTLLTDFGLADTYVGQVKGAMLAVAPNVTIVDLTHSVPPQDVRAGAFLLWSAVEAFAPGTLHVGVVDPGVGSSRRAVAIQSRRGDVFVGPDNGLLLPAVDRLGGLAHAVELTRRQYWGQHTSATFHGRDVFGPVAGYLARGVPLEHFGAAVSELDRSASWPQPNGLSGEVIHLDTYGNLITNLPAVSLPPRFEAHVNGHRARHAAFYAAAEPGELIALVGSAGQLEICARDASAAAITRAKRGTPLALRVLSAEC
jgi:S-adenosylmethionine hydrolase